MINYKRPKKPKDFPPKKIKQESHRIAAKFYSSGSLKSEDFRNFWGDYKNIFIQHQGDGKCGYCETRITAASPGAVDHIRPKAGVIYLKNKKKQKIGKDRVRQEDEKLNPGYWRLAYDWYNWIFVCDTCNSSWKKNQFPTDPKNKNVGKFTYRTEKRLLLNPFVDGKIRTNFEYKYNGIISGTTPMGRSTVDVCGLDRINLVEERKLLVEQVYRHIDDIRVARSINCDSFRLACLRNLYYLSLDKMQYAGMIRYFIAKESSVVGCSWMELCEMAKNGEF